MNSGFSLLYGHIERYVTDISATGAFIRAKVHPTVGTELPLNLTVTDGGIQSICGTGRVVRVVCQDGRPAGIGVEFVALDAESEAVIDKLLARGEQPVPPRPPIRFANPLE